MCVSSSAMTTTDLIPPPVTTAADAEVDLELLKAVPKAFTIEDEQSANWLIKKIISARNYADHVQSWANREIARATREEQTLLYLFGAQLEGWARIEIEKFNGRRKSISLPAGS